MRRAVETLARATAGFARVRFLVSRERLDRSDPGGAAARLRSAITGFQFTSLGALAERLPARTERIAACRNRYLDELRHDRQYARRRLCDGRGSGCCEPRPALRGGGDVLGIAHRRGMSSPPTKATLITTSGRCAIRTGVRWTVTINTSGCVICLVVRARWPSPFIRAWRGWIRRAEWIEVDSAFGGLAIYRREALLGGRYSGVHEGCAICEHVPLHAELRARGYRIFINPALINAHRTDHSARVRFSVRLRRQIESVGQRLRARLIQHASSRATI